MSAAILPPAVLFRPDCDPEDRGGRSRLADETLPAGGRITAIHISASA